MTVTSRQASLPAKLELKHPYQPLIQFVKMYKMQKDKLIRYLYVVVTYASTTHVTLYSLMISLAK